MRNFIRSQQKKLIFLLFNGKNATKVKGFFFAVIRHYLIVLKDGIIPPHYLTWEK